MAQNITDVYHYVIMKNTKELIWEFAKIRLECVIEPQLSNQFRLIRISVENSLVLFCVLCNIGLYVLWFYF